MKVCVVETKGVQRGRFRNANGYRYSFFLVGSKFSTVNHPYPRQVEASITKMDFIAAKAPR